MQCPNCSQQITDTASYCPGCGVDVDAAGEPATDRQRNRASNRVEPSPGEAQQSPAVEPREGDPPPEQSGDAATARETPNRSGGGPPSEADGQQWGRTDEQAGPGPTKQTGAEAAAGASRAAGQATEPGRGQSSDRRRRESTFSFPLLWGAFYGGAAFVVAYANTLLLFGYEVSEQSRDLFSELAIHEAAGWLFYGAHQVEIQHRPETGSSATTVKFLESVYGSLTDPVVPKLVFYALPVVMLLWAGQSVAKRSAAKRRLTDAERFKAGATVAVGYGALAIAAATTVFSVTFTGFDAGTANPELQSVVLFAAVAYPVLVGGLGGYLSKR